MQKVMVFGVFDGLHDGHRHFLREAKRHGDYLIAVVTPDHIVHELKGHLPESHIGDRIERMIHEGFADRVVEGDHEQGSWHILRRHKPGVVAVGYDQDVLRKEIERVAADFGLDIEIKSVSAHKPETHHSSLKRNGPATRHRT